MHIHAFFIERYVEQGSKGGIIRNGEDAYFCEVFCIRFVDDI